MYFVLKLKKYTSTFAEMVIYSQLSGVGQDKRWIRQDKGAVRQEERLPRQDSL